MRKLLGMVAAVTTLAAAPFAHADDTQDRQFVEDLAGAGVNFPNLSASDAGKTAVVICTVRSQGRSISSIAHDFAEPPMSIPYKQAVMLTLVAINYYCPEPLPRQNM